jgi:hypothetical protein
MSTKKKRVGLSAAAITAAGAVGAALIAHLYPPTPTVQTTTLTSPHHSSGVVTTDPGYVTAYVYGTPVTNLGTDRIGEVADGQQVEIVCTVQGPPITNDVTGKTTTLWDKIQYNGGFGFLNDAVVNTNTDQAVAPNC